MFTGIIEELGLIESLYHTTSAYQIKIRANSVLENTKIGDSIAVNGLCLTVSKLEQQCFIADVMPVSLEKSAFKTIKIGEKVNLERALQPQSRMGGHFVTGHIDGIGRILEIKHQQNAILISIQLPDECISKAIPEGSIAVDGISLTIAELEKDRCTVSLIPHSWQQTNLQCKNRGDIVNIESDVLGKYVYHFLQRQNKKMDMDFLINNGFL